LFASSKFFVEIDLFGGELLVVVGEKDMEEIEWLGKIV